MISIIVPIYNASSTIEKCVNSVIKQSYQDWELLLINDGSTDDTLKLCCEYEAIDKRIHVFNKENGGVSSARNVGLDKAKGDWIAFIDSDDYVRRDYLKNLLSHTNESIDLVISYAEVHSKNGFELEKYPSKLVTSENFDSIFIVNDMHWHTSPWSKLYRRGIIEDNNLRFCEGMHIGEDALFLYSYILYSKIIYISSDTDYCYFAYTENSLTKRVNSLDSELLSYNNINSIVTQLIESKKINKTVALNNLYWLIASYQRRVLNALYYNKISEEERRRVLMNIDWHIYTEYIEGSSIKEKIFIILLQIRCFKLYDIVRKLVVSLKN